MLSLLGMKRGLLQIWGGNSVLTNRTLRQLSAIGAVFVLMAIAWTAVAADIPVDAQGRPQWQERQWADFPVQIRVSGPTELRQLLSRVPLAGFSREDLRPDGVLSVRVTPAEAAALSAAGVSYVRLPDREKAGRQAAEQAWAQRFAAGETPVPLADKSDAAALDYYPTHAEIGTLLADLAAAYPAICRTFTWGQTVQGRELWGLVVSADVNNTTAEPEVRLSSTMHGNEVTGMILLVDLAHHLVQNYGQPGYADVTSLVDNTEIHIMPLHNPDGYVAGGRYNANGVDLNRNFPLPAGTHPVQEIENLGFMAYANAHHFVISQNGHGGALVVNYPWDYTYTRAPDDAAIIQLSLEYSSWNLPMFNGSFTDGITNGADWYPVNGSVQDWSYDQTDCIDVTIEVSNTKWPAASTLAGYWDDNRESLLHYIAAARYGVNGVVTDATSGLPLDATVTVTGNTMSVHTDPAHGDYYKLLATGTYELTFSADGYDPVTIADVTTTWGTPTVLDVQLSLSGSSVPAAGPGKLLLAARPNPFNPATRLTLNVPAAGSVAVGVYDLRGRLVRSLLVADLPAGETTLNWNGQADDGATAPSGVYFARAQTAQGAATVKLMLLK